MKAYILLYEILNPWFNPFTHLLEDIDKKVVKEIDHGDWVERIEMWSLNGTDEIEMQSAYSPAGDYIGNVDTLKILLKKGITQFEKTEPDHCVVSIGFNPEEEKWSGWSHRGFASFGIGSKVKKGDCAYLPQKGEWEAKTLDDAKQMAIDFANGVS